MLPSAGMKKMENHSHVKQGFVFLGIIFCGSCPAYKVLIWGIFSIRKILLKQSPMCAADGIPCY